jgi:hypothetical protein
MNQCEKHLKAFCADVLKQIKLLNALKHAEWFEETVGLCDNYKNWLYHHGLVDDIYKRCVIHLRDLFDGRTFPFNGEGNDAEYLIAGDDYWREYDENLLYQNEKRLAFLKEWSEKS